MPPITFNLDLDLDYLPHLPEKKDYGIGCLGAGFIMRDIHLVAYKNAGFHTVAIASRTPENSAGAAAARGVPKVYDTWQELLDDPEVEILDIAFPPDQQPESSPKRSEQATYQGHSGAETAGHELSMPRRSSKCAKRPAKSRRQPEHAL